MLSFFGYWVTTYDRRVKNIIFIALCIAAKTFIVNTNTKWSYYNLGNFTLKYIYIHNTFSVVFKSLHTFYILNLIQNLLLAITHAKKNYLKETKL